MDRALDAAGAGAARRGRRGHRPGRGRGARHGDHRPLPAARRRGRGHHALRHAEDVRVDDRRGHLAPRSASHPSSSPTYQLGLRLAGPQPGSRDGRAPGPAAGDHRRRRGSTGRFARRSSPSTWPRSTTNCTRSSTSGGWLAREREQLGEQEAAIRGREEALREREEQLKRRLETQLEDRLRDARREIDAVVDDVKRRAATLVSQAARRAIGQRAAPLRPARRAPRGPTPGRRWTASGSVLAGSRADKRQRGAGRGPRGDGEGPSRSVATASRWARWASRGSSRRPRTARPRSTSAASGCARRSTNCACSAPRQARRAA